MASWTPLYRPPAHRLPFLTREQKRLRKRKREAYNSDEDDNDDEHDDVNTADLDRSPEPGVKDDPEESAPPRMPHPVNKTDPFYIAGLSREESLPGGGFPHAPLPKARPKLEVGQALAQLNPPLYIPTTTPDNEDGSLRRRHLDNLTAILHKCMLNGDWVRASRAWGLILRTEIQGRGVDVRHNGRWLVGGEILLKRNQRIDQKKGLVRTSGSDEEEVVETKSVTTPAISDEGFRLVRDYYDRLILQYPHMPRQSHATVNALAVYPALFNVWIFEVHDRALRARQQLARVSGDAESDVSSISGKSENSAVDEARRNRLQHIVALELEQAIPIAQRMDDIMLNPPFDKSRELLHLRSMVSLWLTDLSQDSTRKDNISSEEETSLSDLQEAPAVLPRHDILAQERWIAERMMSNMSSLKMEIPIQLRTFVEVAARYEENGG